MIQITPQMRILLAVEPVDFRRGIDGLVAVCRAALGTDPLAGGCVRLPKSKTSRAQIVDVRRSGFLAVPEAPFQRPVCLVAQHRGARRGQTGSASAAFVALER